MRRGKVKHPKRGDWFRMVCVVVGDSKWVAIGGKGAGGLGEFLSKEHKN